METVDSLSFNDEYEAAFRYGLLGGLSHWEGHPKAYVALLVLINQVPRLRFEGADIYKGDKMSYDVVMRAHKSGVLKRIPPEFRILSYVVLSQQENMDAHKLLKKEWKGLKKLLKNKESNEVLEKRFKR